MASEIYRERVLANFRPTLSEKASRKPRRWTHNRPGMSDDHLAMIRRMQCTVCHQRKWLHAHHLTGGVARLHRGVSFKAPDKFTVPLCSAHHADLHTYGSRREAEWFAAFGMDPYSLAEGLWNRKGDAAAMARVLTAHQLEASTRRFK